MRRPVSLALHLLFWILPIVASVTAAVSVATYLIARAGILEELRRNALAVTSVSAARAESFFRQQDGELATIAESPLFRDHYLNLDYGLAQEAEVHRRQIERMLAAFSARSGVYPRLRYLDASGRVLAVVRDQTVVDRHRELPPGPEVMRAIRKLRPGARVTLPPARMPWHGAQIVRQLAGLHDERGRLRGAVVFDCSLGPLISSLALVRIGRSGRSYLVPLRSASQAFARVEEVEGRITVSAPVGRGPWVVLTVLSRDEFLERLKTIRSWSLAILLAGAGVIVLVVWRRVRALLEPIRSLVAAVTAFSEERDGARAAVEGPIEVAALAASFNTMAERLSSRTDDLKQRVRELTQLHRLNEAVVRQLGRSAIARACLEAAVEGLQFERGVLYWVDEERGEIVGECVYGLGESLNDEQIRSRRVALSDKDVLAEVVRRRAPVYVADAAADPRCNPEWVAEAKVKSFCAAPVIGRERVIAVICVDYKISGRPLTPAKMRSFSLFCGAAGLALENAQLIEAIVKSEARYRTAVENSPYAVVGLDQNFRITLWNRRAEEMFGYQPTEAFGRELEFVMEKERYAELRREVEVRGAVRHAEIAGHTRDGRRLELAVGWTGQDGSGGAREWFVVLQDETQQKRLQSQLIQAEKISAVGNLVAGVCHELNNPLTGVIGFAELLKDRELHQSVREDIATMHASALRCKDIVHGLLRFARQDARPLLQKVSLNAVAEAAAALFEYRLVRAEGIELDLRLDPAAPRVAGEFHRIQQILVNLLGNAHDALKGRLGRRAVAIVTRALAGGGASIEVEDNGPGIPAGKRGEIFEPFYTTKAPGMGTGLGLSISADIMREYGGSLSCEPVESGGARFVARFPPCPAGVPEEETGLGLPPPTRGCRALVVDDEPELVALMMRMLEDDGIVPTPAIDPRAAKRLLEEGAVELVIADVDMGAWKGTSLIESARQSPSRPAMLIVTGDVLNRELMGALRAALIPVLTKPFLRTDFLRAVRRALFDRASALPRGPH